jgi:hypothetical protein
MTDSATPSPSGPASRPLYLDEDFFGEHIVATGEDPDRTAATDGGVPEDDVWLEARDEVRIRAGTRLILEAQDLIEIRASEVDFVQVPNVGESTDVNATTTHNWGALNSRACRSADPDRI